ncbi:MAG: universal stress protein [Phycisphaerales bacterium]
MPESVRSPLRRILVATDLSRAASAAVERAIELAAAHHAGVDLVHAIDRELDDLEPAVHAREVDEVCDRYDELAVESGVTIVRHLQRGRASDVIPELVAQLEPELVILGSRGRTLWDRIFLGSVADRVLRRVTRPVMIVHPTDTDDLADPRTAVVAMDGSAASLAALDFGLRLLSPRRGPATIRIVHADRFAANPLVRAAGADRADAHVAEARKQIESVCAKVLEEHASATPDAPPVVVEYVVEAAHPAELVCREADQCGADVVCVGAQGEIGLEALLLGSTAERVINGANCPVVAVRG